MSDHVSAKKNCNHYALPLSRLQSSIGEQAQVVPRTTILHCPLDGFLHKVAGASADVHFKRRVCTREFQQGVAKHVRAIVLHDRGGHSLHDAIHPVGSVRRAFDDLRTTRRTGPNVHPAHAGCPPLYIVDKHGLHSGAAGKHSGCLAPWPCHHEHSHHDAASHGVLKVRSRTATKEFYMLSQKDHSPAQRLDVDEGTLHPACATPYRRLGKPALRG